RRRARGAPGSPPAAASRARRLPPRPVRPAPLRPRGPGDAVPGRCGARRRGCGDGRAQRRAARRGRPALARDARPGAAACPRGIPPRASRPAARRRRRARGNPAPARPAPPPGGGAWELVVETPRAEFTRRASVSGVADGRPRLLVEDAPLVRVARAARTRLALPAGPRGG